jgi:uncharacterized protein DUF3565
MKQKIVGFDQDDEHHWRAILECGHRQHLRHDPPMTTRPWVLTEAGRASRLGYQLDCKRCDETPPQEFDGTAVCLLCVAGTQILLFLGRFSLRRSAYLGGLRR